MNNDSDRLQRRQGVLTQLTDPLFTAAGVDVAMLRLDQYDAMLSGNKYFKLKYNLRQAKALGCRRIVSFGGAYSNHIHALALAARAEGLAAVAIIRGEPSAAANPTLSDAVAAGMQLHFVDRTTYRRRDTPAYRSELGQLYPNSYILPEGGGNLLGVRGCMDIAALVTEVAGKPFDTVALAVGSGSTLAGMVAGFAVDNNATVTELLGISVLKKAYSLDAQVADYLQQIQCLQAICPAWNPPKWTIDHNFHCGGYAKVSSPLAQFISYFQQQHGIVLEPVYTGKLMLALYRLIDRGLMRDKRLLVVHTGGLQGLRGMRDQLDKYALVPAQETAIETILRAC